MLFRTRIPVLSGALLGVLVAAGCLRAPKPEIYEARGVVREAPADGRTVVIRHEDIPGYMKAMTMSFDVKDTNELAHLAAGDLVRFRILVTPKDGWIDQVRVVGHTNLEPAQTAPAGMRLLPIVPLLGDSDEVPDYAFTNQLGRRFRMRAFHGQALALTFIFTRCPYPDFCPRMTDRFGEVARKLKQQPNGPTNWQLLSLSFDPEYDTPETLRAYGERFGYDPQHWTLASGDFGQVEPLAGNFGLYFARDVPPTEQNHNLRTAVIDAAGRVQQIFIGNEWTADELVEQMLKAAAAKPSSPDSPAPAGRPGS